MVKNLPANAGDARDSSSIPGSGRCPGIGKTISGKHTGWHVALREHQLSRSHS